MQFPWVFAYRKNHCGAKQLKPMTVPCRQFSIVVAPMQLDYQVAEGKIGEFIHI